jgi:hypothetical protein
MKQVRLSAIRPRAARAPLARPMRILTTAITT